MKIGTKILVAVTTSIVLASTVSLIIQQRVIREQGENLVHQKMKGLLIEAEETVKNISYLSNKNIFDKEQLAEDLNKVDHYSKSTFYQTIPVIVGLNGLIKATKAENLTVRMVRQEPRNPKNTPTEFESKILEEFSTNGTREFFKIDDVNDQIVYARPIYSNQSCMQCHGDPLTSTTGDGKDVFGFSMESWKPNEFHGAYILYSNMDQINSVVMTASQTLILWLLPIATFIAIAFMFLVRKSIIKPLETSIKETQDGTSTAKATATKIAEASTTLAEGAARQAASIEETSASLEEMSATTRNCLENTKKAASLSSSAKTDVQRGNDSVSELVSTMQAIEDSSNEITQVIKVIEDIAFQTNILSINASVEAARAGQAGAGFATVADEVRNLAQKAAQAAQETAKLVENSKKRSKEGSVACDRVNQDLKEILEAIDKLSIIVQEVDSAASEQNLGIEQINQAIAEIDEVAQSTAHGAENASASVMELDNQSKILTESVGKLSKIIDG